MILIGVLPGAVSVSPPTSYHTSERGPSTRVAVIRCSGLMINDRQIIISVHTEYLYLRALVHHTCVCEFINVYQWACTCKPCTPDDCRTIRIERPGPINQRHISTVMIFSKYSSFLFSRPYSKHASTVKRSSRARTPPFTANLATRIVIVFFLSDEQYYFLLSNGFSYVKKIRRKRIFSGKNIELHQRTRKEKLLKGRHDEPTSSPVRITNCFVRFV